NDISAINRQLTEKLPFIKDITDNRKQVLLNMAFNLGIYGLLKFRRMLNAMDCADYVEAGQQMLDSRWAEQVGDRAVELAHMMIEG
ncbi:MAG: lysozyme, partial [Algicola sp.]|nr:lysozyme [Algicola sp.]